MAVWPKAFESSLKKGIKIKEKFLSKADIHA